MALNKKKREKTLPILHLTSSNIDLSKTLLLFRTLHITR